MTSLTRPRGPLPPRVYWVRRVVVLAVALVLVVGVSMLLKMGSDGNDGANRADTAAVRKSSGDQSTPGGAEGVSGVPATTPTPTSTPTPTPTELATPSGTCTPEDVVVTPTVAEAEADSPVTLQLSLSTRTSEACTWRVASRSLTLKITKGGQDVWLSTECRRAITRQDVVVRKAIPAVVQVVWDSHYSDGSCSGRTEWAMPGWYDVSAAALGGEPSSTRFRLVRPATTTVTITPDPTPTNRDKGRKSPSGESSQSESSTAESTPSGAVEPNG